MHDFANNVFFILHFFQNSRLNLSTLSKLKHTKCLGIGCGG